MKKILILLTVTLTLAGCGNSENSEKDSENTAIKNSSLTLHDGTKVTLSGAVMKVFAKPNNKGELKLHEVNFKSNAKAAESSVYNTLSKLGYTRKVIESSGSGFKVHYYKKDQPVIGNIYQEQTTPTGQSSQLSMYWQSI